MANWFPSKDKETEEPNLSSRLSIPKLLTKNLRKENQRHEDVCTIDIWQSFHVGLFLFTWQYERKFNFTSHSKALQSFINVIHNPLSNLRHEQSYCYSITAH
jgi:hypothetical protein